MPATTSPSGTGAPFTPDLALLRAVPDLRGRLPWVCCTRLPTPVQRLEQFGAAIGARHLWIKRDDGSGPLYGGNKPRKLEFMLGDAIARGKTAVMTFGGIGTNHGLATALYARHYGLRTLLLLVEQPVTEKVRHGLLLYHACGAEMHFAASVPAVAATAVALCARELARGHLPYVIPAGGSAPLGVLGYVNAAFELKEQIDAGAIPVPDHMFVPVGTAGTLAGLVLGCRLAGIKSRVVGVLVTDILPPTPARTARLANRAQAILRRAAPGLPSVRITADEVPIVTGFLGARYGMPTEDARALRDELARLEGIPAETTYTAKCLAAVRALAAEPPYRDGVLLYWHTYSAVDPAATLAVSSDPRQLPRAFHRFFEGATIPD